MDLDVPVSHPSGGDGDGEQEAAACKVVVGYAIRSKKSRSFLQPKFVGIARSKGIEFVHIDLNKPLSEQGPFDIILHKLEGKEWSQAVQGVKPEVVVLDPPEAIQRVRNRQLMLEVVADLKLPDCDGQVCIPRQVVISNDPTSIPDAVTKAGLRVPLVVKPLIVDGSAKSHELSLAYDLLSLTKLDTPVVLQEFINHGAVLFKVFIVGESIRVVRRSSLPDVTETDSAKISGIIPFQRVSRAVASAENTDQKPSNVGGQLITAELPPQPLVEVLARELRQRLGLQLFNMDIIRKKGTNDYYVIDINYFPGYGKMPDYEHIFTNFLLGIVQNKEKQ